MTWVTGPKLTELRGYTAGQQKARRQRGHWTRGIEYDEIDGALMYNVAAIDARADCVAAGRAPKQRRHQRSDHSLMRLH